MNNITMSTSDTIAWLKSLLREGKITKEEYDARVSELENNNKRKENN